MKMTFYNPHSFTEEAFSAASLGIVCAGKNSEVRSAVCPIDLQGTVVKGTYEEILKNIPHGKWQAGIVLLGNAGNENEFIRALKKKVNAPLTGGSAATNPDTGEKALISGRSEAAVFLINDDRYNVEVICKNIHKNIIGEHKITFSGRFIDEIDGCEPKAWLLKQKEALGIEKEDFEHMTLTDEFGINAHLSEVDGKIFSGRDLSEKMYLRYIDHSEVQHEIQAFYDDKDAVVFGCAGLKGILDSAVSCDGTGLFMYGEVCTVNGHSDFGNLMLSKLVITEK